MELLKLDLSGLGTWTQRAQVAQERLADLSPVFEAGDTWFRAEMAKQFETQGAYLQNGEMWTPLSAEYAKRKPEPPAPFGILYLTGDLYRSLAEAGDAQHVAMITPTSGTYGSTVEYGRYHQAGSPPLPQRKMVIARDALRRLFVDGILGYVLRGKTPSGGQE